MEAEAILRIVDTMAREKNVDKELIFQAIEHALLVAARRKAEDPDTIQSVIDRQTGEISISNENDEHFDVVELGRIAAQTAKQVIIQKVREAERDQIFEEYSTKKGEILSGVIQRLEGRSDAPNLVINIGGRIEAFFPRKEQIFDERFNVGDRIRAILLDVRKQSQKVKLMLSRAHPAFVQKLFELEVPEIADHVIDIKAVEREAGHRTKIAVSSHDQKVDCVGACVGVRGSRIKGIIDELNGEKIDIVRWNDQPELLIQNALKPARINSITLDYDKRLARVVVPNDQLSLAIGKRGQNVRLGAKLCRWDFHIITETQEAEWRGKTIAKFKEIPGIDDEFAYKLFDVGFDSFADIHAAGPEPIMNIKDVDVEKAAAIIGHVQEHPDEAIKIEDAVFATGAYRTPEGTFLEPGQPRPGDFQIELAKTSAGGEEAGSPLSQFDQLFASQSGKTEAVQATEEGRVKLGDIFA